MYGLPMGFDAIRFVGCILEQISFSANTVHFSFNKNISITVESSFTHSIKNGHERISVPVMVSKVMQLIGQTIKSADGAVDGTLTLIFTDGQILSCHDDSKMYESYRIQFGNEEIIV